MVPELSSDPFASVIGMHHEQSDEGVVGVVCHPSDAAHPFRALPGHPDDLVVGLGVDLDVANAWCEVFVTGQARDEVQIRTL